MRTRICTEERGNRRRVVAHRGASGYAPENTLAGFKVAAAMGVSYIELDVHMSRDGEIMVIHDPRVDRTTDGKGADCIISNFPDRVVRLLVE